MALDHIRNLVFEGGGVKGIAYVGALQVLEEEGVLKNVKRFCGTSAGSITAWLGSYFKDNLTEIERIQKKTDFNEFADDDWGIVRDAHRLLNRYGWHKGDKFYQWAQDVTKRRFKKNHMTFQELFDKTGNELLVVGFNVSKGKTVIFSKERTPDFFVERAIRISMSIPFYFRAIFMQDKNVDRDGNIRGNPGIDKDVDKGRDIFVDGGVLDNYPIQFFDVRPYVDNKLRGEVITVVRNRTPRHYNKSTLGFRLDTPAELGIGQIEKDEDQYKAENFFKYMIAYADILHSYANKRHLDSHDWHRTIRINTLDIKSTQFDLTRRDQNNLIKEGRKATEEYLKQYNSSWLNYYTPSKPRKRPSVRKPKSRPHRRTRD